MVLRLSSSKHNGFLSDVCSRSRKGIADISLLVAIDRLDESHRESLVAIDIQVDRVDDVPPRGRRTGGNCWGSSYISRSDAILGGLESF